MAVRGKGALERCGVGHWSHDKCPAGEKRFGWIAGDTHVFPCHSSKASKPCCRLLAGDHAKCPGCEANTPIKELGYVPLYRADGKPMFIVVQSYAFEQLDKLKLHAHVEWGREKAKGEGIWIRKSELNRPWSSTIPAKMRPVDISEALCKVWRMPELIGYARAWVMPSDNAVSIPPNTPPSTGMVPTFERSEAATSARLAAKVKRMEAKERGLGTLSDALPAFSTNGVHKDG